jgi:hypothetical protein
MNSCPSHSTLTLNQDLPPISIMSTDESKNVESSTLRTLASVQIPQRQRGLAQSPWPYLDLYQDRSTGRTRPRRFAADSHYAAFGAPQRLNSAAAEGSPME